jgi:hypothetical protein
MPKPIPPLRVSSTIQISDHMSYENTPTTCEDVGPSGRTVQGVGPRPLASWDCRFEFRRGHVRLSVVNVVCCQIEVSAVDWSLLQRRIPTECGVLVCDRVASIKIPWPTSSCCAMEKKTCEVRVEWDIRSCGTWSCSLVNRFPRLCDHFFATKYMEPITHYWGVISQKVGYFS